MAESGGLENRCPARDRGFESHPLRQTALYAFNNAVGLFLPDGARPEGLDPKASFLRPTGQSVRLLSLRILFLGQLRLTRRLLTPQRFSQFQHGQGISSAVAQQGIP